MLQLAAMTGSSELARFANAADYEHPAKLGQHGYDDVAFLVTAFPQNVPKPRKQRQK